METFGEKLREAIDTLGLSLEEVALATGLAVHRLEALARDDFDALPEDEVVADDLRELARILGVDPDEVIDYYLEARARQQTAEPDRPEMEAGQESGPEAGHEEAEREAGRAAWQEAEREVPHEEVEPEVEQEVARPRRIVWPVALGLIAAAVFVAGFLLLDLPASPGPRLLSVGEPEPHVTDVQSPEPAAPVVRDAAPQADLVTRDATPPAAPVAPSQTEEPAIQTGLAVPRRGVGTGVVDHELVGEARQFAEGSRVWFWTHVQGGQPGQTIDHVWLHEGREVLRVPLRLGGERWRTQSYKNLHSGSQGNWVVEARDEHGQVLARSAFDCSPGA